MELVSFVIPCYRSEKMVAGVVSDIEAAMATPDMAAAYEHEIVLVNDGSPDSTAAVIKQLAQTHERVTAIDLAKNFGQHAALMAGLRQTRGDIVVCLDDDGQTPADEVGKLLDKIEDGHDAVYAKYEHKQHSGFRNWGSKVNAWMLVSMIGKPKDLYMSSYFAVKRFVVDEMVRYENCYPYVGGLVLRTTRNICNVPVNHRSRNVGESGYTLHKLLGLWLNGFTSLSIKPLRIATYTGVATAVVGFVYLITILVRFAMGTNAPMGWRSTAAIMLVLGGLILIVLGLIGEYVGRIFMCINDTPQYVIREVVQREDRSLDDRKGGRRS